jgi:hypothetical protein
MPALRPLLLLLALAAPPAAMRDAAAPAAPATCEAPPELIGTDAPLPATAHALDAGQLKLVVVGSASVLGPGTSGPSAAWPQQLEAVLAARHPGLKVELSVRGARGLTAADTAAIIAQEMVLTGPSLVLWQTGTVEAARSLDLDPMVEALDGTLQRLAAAGTDAMLVDLQFSRFLRANANVEPYLEAIRLAAAAHDVPLLPRYELMRFWAENDRVDLEHAPRATQVAVADRLNRCLAEAAALVIEAGVALAKDGARR